MTGDSFLQQDLRVLTPEAFEFVLANELKRALRSQNFVTLVLIEPRSSGDVTIGDITRVVSPEVRETDLLSATGEGRLSMVLLDADLHNSERVITRVLSRLEHYQFTAPIDIEVGAACCPTDGADIETLTRVAARAAAARRDARGNASHAQ